MQSPLFVDASAWLAAANQRDHHHTVASDILRTCFAQGIHLVTTNWTAYEAVSLLKSRRGAVAVDSLWSIVTNRRSVTLVEVDQEIEHRALDLFFSYRDKTWGVVDCANLVVMADFRCEHAFGFDHHFVEASRQRGFTVVP